MSNAYHTSCPTNGIFWCAAFFGLAWAQVQFDLVSALQTLVG